MHVKKILEYQFRTQCVTEFDGCGILNQRPALYKYSSLSDVNMKRSVK